MRMFPLDTIRVFVVDDHPIFRRGMATLFADEPGLIFAGEAVDGVDAVQRIVAAAPDVVLMDVHMPRMDGIAAIEALRPRLPAAHFVVLSGLLDAAKVHRAMAAGASGVLSKTASQADILQAIRAAHRGQPVFSPEVAELMMDGPPSSSLGRDLTKRERALLGLMVRGMSNQEISSTLTIAEPTVKFHITNILSKLQVKNRTAAVTVALRHRICMLEQ